METYSEKFRLNQFDKQKFTTNRPFYWEYSMIEELVVVVVLHDNFDPYLTFEYFLKRTGMMRLTHLLISTSIKIANLQLSIFLYILLRASSFSLRLSLKVVIGDRSVIKKYPHRKRNSQAQSLNRKDFIINCYIVQLFCCTWNFI
jgi:hypothetical protein